MSSQKTIHVSMQCKLCGRPLVFDAPSLPNMADPCPSVYVNVQPCKECMESMAMALYKRYNPGWGNISWSTYKGSTLDMESTKPKDLGDDNG